jgi:hypothetical protein
VFPTFDLPEKPKRQGINISVNIHREKLTYPIGHSLAFRMARRKLCGLFPGIIDVLRRKRKIAWYNRKE